MPEYSKDQLKELFETLPKKLQEALYSEQTGKNIKEICEKNNIDDINDVWEVNKYVGYVLFGLLPPDNLSDTLENELKIEKDAAEKISGQISRFIFVPVKSILEPLYGTKIEFKNNKEKTSEAPLSAKKKTPTTKESSNGDSYRELIK